MSNSSAAAAAYDVMSLLVGANVNSATRNKIAAAWLKEKEGSFPPRIPHVLLGVYSEASPFNRLKMWAEFG